jgi:hypothetical protein
VLDNLGPRQRRPHPAHGADNALLAKTGSRHDVGVRHAARVMRQCLPDRVICGLPDGFACGNAGSAHPNPLTAGRTGFTGLLGIRDANVKLM